LYDIVAKHVHSNFVLSIIITPQTKLVQTHLPKTYIYQYHAFTLKFVQTHLPKSCIHNPNLSKHTKTMHLLHHKPNLSKHTKPCIHKPNLSKHTKTMHLLHHKPNLSNFHKPNQKCPTYINYMSNPFLYTKCYYIPKKKNMTNIRNFNASILVFFFSTLTQ
jgi:hypothetical protein